MFFSFHKLEQEGQLEGGEEREEGEGERKTFFPTLFYHTYPDFCTE